jgi:hypothetical protein
MMEESSFKSSKPQKNDTLVKELKDKLREQESLFIKEKGDLEIKLSKHVNKLQVYETQIQLRDKELKSKEKEIEEIEIQM